MATRPATDPDAAETIGRFRDVLGSVAEHGPNASGGATYRELREQLTENSRVNSLLPDFVIECRSPRDFWNYIQRSFNTYAERSRYVEAQLLPIERQFRPERDRAVGVRPPEVRIEYSPVRPASPSGLTLVSESRIAELRSLQSNQFDLRKVIRLCEELNVTFAEGCYFSVAALTREVLDHVPPVFQKTSFTEVANNHGGRSFKDSMRRLNESARSISDSLLHQQIRARETLPAAQQVNFAAELDVLLGEVVRLLS